MKFVHDGSPVAAEIGDLIVAGWTGRDAAAVAHHIDELRALGVAPPSATPLFYRVSRDLLTLGDTIDVLGDATSGEAEPLVIDTGGQRWLGLASDHTDRALEATSVAASKQICAKVCAGEVWDMADVSDHLDALHLRAWIDDGQGWTLYQDGTLASILPLPALIERAGLRDGAAMLCGTLPAIGGVRAAAAFRAELVDPVRGRTIQLEYRLRVLPMIS